MSGYLYQCINRKLINLPAQEIVDSRLRHATCLCSMFLSPLFLSQVLSNLYHKLRASFVIGGFCR